MLRPTRLRLLTWALAAALLTTALSFFAAFGVWDYRPWLFAIPLIGVTFVGLVLEFQAHMANEEVVMEMPEMAQTSDRVRNPQPLRRPWLCPVCRGAGEVDEALYTRVRASGGLKIAPCRSCENGIVWG